MDERIGPSFTEIPQSISRAFNFNERILLRAVPVRVLRMRNMAEVTNDISDVHFAAASCFRAGQERLR